MSAPEVCESPEELLKHSTNPGLLAGLWGFVRTSRKWWLLPFLFAFLLLGLLIVLANTAAAPLIYTLF